MAINHIRTCLVGTQEDMYTLCTAMLRACGAWDDDEDGPVPSLDELIERIHREASLEGGRDDGFLYDMLCPSPFGRADKDSCRFTVTRTPCGLWSAAFALQSGDPFQPEDWMNLHRRCGRMPLVALYASDDFTLEKGAALISNGRIMDNWNTMDEGWLWLTRRYECGIPPEEAVQHLQPLQQLMDDEEYDLSVAELLDSCMENLQSIHAVCADWDALADTIGQARAAGDWNRLLSCQIAVAEYGVWEVDHIAMWMSTLSAISQAWEEV